MTRKIALIAGVGGMCGGNMARLLHANGDWDVIGISRGDPDLGDLGDRVRHVAVDLLDREGTLEALRAVRGVTHVFYTALLNGRTPDEENALNTRMAVNFLDGVVPHAEALRHVHVLEGVKWYGYHLGAYKTPAREDDPPCVPAYFYEAQHAHVLRLQRGRSWSWSTTRPGAVCGYGKGARINLMTVVAVYASVMKALGLPLYFPGDEATYDALTFATDVRILNRAMLWASTDPRAADQAFNIGNGDAFRWRHLWPRLAAMFGLEPGPVKDMRLAEFMADKRDLWAGIAARDGLREPDLSRIVLWDYADTVFHRRWDNMISAVKAYRCGFTDMIDTEQMMAEMIADFRRRKIIP